MIETGQLNGVRTLLESPMYGVHSPFIFVAAGFLINTLDAGIFQPELLAFTMVLDWIVMFQSDFPSVSSQYQTLLPTVVRKPVVYVLAI